MLVVLLESAQQCQVKGLLLLKQYLKTLVALVESRRADFLLLLELVGLRGDDCALGTQSTTSFGEPNEVLRRAYLALLGPRHIVERPLGLLCDVLR
jgi:hypothetical protein